MFYAGTVDRMASGKVVGAVDDDVAPQPRADPVGLRQPSRGPGPPRPLGSALRWPLRAASTLGLPTSRVRKTICRCRLVRSTRIAVAQDDRSHAGGCKVDGHRRAQTARSDHQDVRPPDALLSLDADCRKKDVAAVAGELLVVHLPAGGSRLCRTIAWSAHGTTAARRSGPQRVSQGRGVRVDQVPCCFCRTCRPLSRLRA